MTIFAKKVRQIVEVEVKATSGGFWRGYYYEK